MTTKDDIKTLVELMKANRSTDTTPDDDPGELATADWQQIRYQLPASAKMVIGACHITVTYSGRTVIAARDLDSFNTALQVLGLNPVTLS
jgi:hypothetical protein